MIIWCERRRLHRRRVKESDSLLLLFCKCLLGEMILYHRCARFIYKRLPRKELKRDYNVIREKCYICVCLGFAALAGNLIKYLLIMMIMMMMVVVVIVQPKGIKKKLKTIKNTDCIVVLLVIINFSLWNLLNLISIFHRGWCSYSTCLQ